MSFSYSVKEELVRVDSRNRHCRIAELAAVYAFCRNDAAENGGSLCIRTDNPLLRRRVFTLLRKTFKITKYDKEQDSPETEAGILIADPAEAERVRSAVVFHDTEDALSRICARSCCARAFLRGAFLSAGSVSNPEKSYHFEIVCAQRSLADLTAALIGHFEIDARIVSRKGRSVVYVKEGTQIVDLLNVMGAHASLMEMENIRIVKDVRNRVNRQVNCETANLKKTVNASVREIEEITLLEEAGILKRLPQSLQETAALRIEYPDASLKELGELHDPPIGRSGVNHRLKKISSIASSFEIHGGEWKQ